MTPVRQSQSLVPSRSPSPEPAFATWKGFRSGSPDSFETAPEWPLVQTPDISPCSSPVPSLALPQGFKRLRPVPGTPPLAAAPEDLSLPMRTVWMPDALGVQRNFLADMASLAVRYDYRLIVQVGSQTTVAYSRDIIKQLSGLSEEELQLHVGFIEAGDAFTSWGEDNKILTLPDALGRPTILYPPRLRHGVFEAAEAYVREEGYHPYSESFQGAVSQRNEGQDAWAFAKRVGMKSRCTASYLEGGNVLTGQLPNGEPYAIVGRDSLIISTFALRMDDVNRHSKAAIRARRAELETQGFFTEARLQDTIAKLQETRSQQSSWRDWLRGLVVTEDDARDFCAEMELTHDVIARDLGLPPQHVWFVAQPDFHIDMHMRPMFAGEVLLNDPRTTVMLLEGLLAMDGIPMWQREELTSMLDDAEDNVAQFSDTVDEIAEQLEAAGLTCKRIPGVMESHRRHANFMNGIPGRLPDGSTFYFTNASSLTFLQRAIAQYFKSVVGVDNIEFVGGAGGGPWDANAAEESLEQSGGLDCREVHSSAAFGLPDAA